MNRRHALKRRIMTLFLCLFGFGLFASVTGVACFDDSEMIDRHERKLEEEDE